MMHTLQIYLRCMFFISVFSLVTSLGCMNQSSTEPQNKIYQVTEEIPQASDLDVALLYACQHNNLPELKSLLQQKAQVNTVYQSWSPDYKSWQEKTPLIQAVQNCNYSLLNFLLEFKADPNLCVPTTELSPLTVASSQGLSCAVGLLLHENADPNISDAFGGSPLLAACERGHLRTVDMLLEAKADVNKQANQHYGGITPLTQTVQNGYRRILPLLIKAGADINKARYDGWTPLHLAVFNNRPHIIGDLLAKGADTRLRTSDGKLPSDYAATRSLRALLKTKPKDVATQSWRAKTPSKKLLITQQELSE